jgi:multiple sugar transport system permease protein
MMPKTNRNKQSTGIKVPYSIRKNPLWYIVTTSIVTISLFPLFWTLISTLKTKREVAAGDFWPSGFSVEGFIGLTETIFFNSLFITFIGALISVSLCIIINLLAAYAFARMDFYGKKILWILILLPMFVPGMTILVPLYLVVSNMGILDTLLVLIIPGVAQAIHIFFMRQFFLNIPNALEEAAKLDGANSFQIFIHLFLPLASGPTVIVGIGAFMGYWNAYLWPALVIDSDGLKQIMQVIQSFKPVRDPNWPLIMAASMIAMVIPLILYFIFQKRIVENLKISGLK